MVDDKTTSQADSALVQFGIFDWVDRNQLQLPDLYEQRLQCLEYADEAGFYFHHLAQHQGTALGTAPPPCGFPAPALQPCRPMHPAPPGELPPPSLPQPVAPGSRSAA